MVKIVAADHAWSALPEPEGEVEDFKQMTAQEAGAWRVRQAKLSMVWVLGVQFAMLVGATLLLALVHRQSSAYISLLYGGCAVWIPSVVMAFGLRFGGAARVFGRVAQGALGVMWFWEGVKLLLSVLIMLAAPVLIRNLNWLAFFAGLVLVLKVYWLSLLWQSCRAPSIDGC